MSFNKKMLGFSEKISPAERNLLSPHALATDQAAFYRFSVSATAEWFEMFQDLLLTVLHAHEVPAITIDDIYTATLESWENIVRHSKGDNKLIIKVTGHYIKFIFFNKGELSPEGSKKTLKEFLGNVWRVDKNTISFGAGSLLIDACMDEFERFQKGDYVYTILRKDFPPRTRLTARVPTITGTDIQKQRALLKVI